LNTTDIANILAERHGITKASAKTIVADVFAEVLDAAKRGEDTSIPGFGKFAAKHRAAREGRNPRTGETATFPANVKLAFSPAKAAKDALNA